MQPFDHVAAMQGAEVCTRAGKMAYILSISQPCKFYGMNYPIVAVFEDMGGNVNVGCFTEQGMEQYHTESGNDLMMLHDDYLECLNVKGKHPATPRKPSDDGNISDIINRLALAINDLCKATDITTELFGQLSVEVNKIKASEEERSRGQRDERAKASEHIR